MNEEHLNILLKVVKKLIKKPFSYHTEEDLEQEALIIGLSVYKKWDGIRPLENFLSVSIKNRLISFRRNEYERHPGESSKKNILEPINYDIINPDNEDSLQYDEPDYISEKEFLDEIDEIIPGYLREYYLKMIDGVSIPHNRRLEIREIIKDYLDD